MTETLSIKVPREKKIRLHAIARARKTRASALLREALDQLLAGAAIREQPSCYDLCKDILENLEASGPADLSTNPKYLKNFGK